MRRDLAARLREIGNDDGMAEAWRLRNAVSGSGLCDNAMANVALMADYIDRPVCRNAPGGRRTEFKCSSCGHMHDFGYGFNYCPNCGAVVVK